MGADRKTNRMSFSNLRIATRFLLKHKEYTLINVIGLSLSLVCVLFIGLYCYDELSFDRFHNKADRIYRIIEHETANDGTTSRMADVGFRLATLGDELPAIEQGCRITAFGRANFSTPENDAKIYESFVVSEQAFLDIFDFPVIQGSREKALTRPHTVIITRSTAMKLFGRTDVVDKVIHNDRDDQPFRVTAVLEDPPANSHLQMSMIFSLESFAHEKWYEQELTNDWSSHGFATYILNNADTDKGALEKSIDAIVTRNRKKQDAHSSFTLQPLADVHFHSADIRGGFSTAPGEISYLYIFGAVGIFILVIACINYVNLSTSLSITRGKEIGIKKVAGAARYNLIRQFITESNLICLVSLVLALMVVNVLMPSFNDFAGKSLDISFLWDLKVLAVLIGFTLLTGTLSGSYPAFYLSHFKPATAIKGFSSVRKKGMLRQGLVVFQFALSITLILATFIAYQQLSYIRNKNLGFQHDQVVVLDINSGAVRKGFEVIKDELMSIPEVKDVTVSSRVPGEWKNLPQVGVAVGNSETPEQFYFMGVDDAFFRTFEIDLVAGRNFTAINPADSASFIINETAAKALGFNGRPGEPLSIASVNYAVSEDRLEHPFKGRIIGIVKDFHFQSLHQKIGPLIVAYYNNPIHSIDYFSVRLTEGNVPAVLKQMERALHKVDPTHLLEYNFLDQRLEDFYRQDVKRGQIFALAAGVSIGLACLGLFSLVSFMTEQRTKEIGVRKVLGATSAQIVLMLSGNYLKLVMIGFVIATPLAIWTLGKWLESFAYRITIDWITVLAACILSLMVALLTVGYKSLGAAKRDPVKSLRNE